ncbi:flagellar FlbD family protein [Halalkalibacillus halophilus]|uniref:flagellar FlbD family protein n=1 Tax=Halalkalibacillus halophilus TaxID=392827 RepID=UPI00040B13C2|nr:flagellar FlbD family protein [Halalkalibacillus halophilus]
MIEVTRLDDEVMVINALYIEKIQALPDTTISLSNGKKYFVKEPVDQVINLVTNYYKQIGLMDLQAKVVEQNDETN